MSVEYVNAFVSSYETNPADELSYEVKSTKKRPPRFLTEKVRKDTLEMVQNDDFVKADPIHLIALHDELHRSTYGDADPDTMGRELQATLRMVTGLYHSMGRAQLLDFIKWAWLTERKREIWRRENHRDGGRLGAKMLFTRHKVTEYRISLTRQSAR